MSNLNPKDLDLVSNAILDNSLSMDKLPTNVQDSLVNYWQQSGVNFGDPQTSQAQLESLVSSRQAAGQSSPLDSPIFKPIEWVGSKLYWLYSNTVSPAISAAGQAAHTLIYGRPDYIGEDGELDAFKDYWELGKSVSPGQSIWQLGLNSTELKARGIRPDQMAQDKKLAAKGEKTTSDEYFGHGAAKWVTGTTDFAVSWYADPLVLAGKAGGLAKATAFTKNVAKSTEEGTSLAAMAGQKLGIAKTAEQKYADLVQGTTFDSMVNTVMKIKKTEGDKAPLVLRRDMPTLDRSANGDAFARLLHQARDEDEVRDVLRVSIGDDAAKVGMEVKNVQLSGQIKTLTLRNSNVGASFDALTDAEKAAPRGQMMKQHLDDGTAFVNKLNEETRFLDDAVNQFGKLDNLNYNRVTTPIGIKVKGAKAWQEGDQLRPMRGQGIIKATPALVYNATIGGPIKLIRSYNDIRPGHYIDIHGEDSYRQVDASLRQVDKTLLSRGEREMLVSNYVKATPADRQLELIKAEQYTVSKMVERHNVKARKNGDPELELDVAKSLYKDFAQRRRSGQTAAGGQGQLYGAGTMPDPANPSLTIRTAEFDPTGSQIVTSPIFDTQLANSHVMMDFNAFDRLLAEHGSTFQKLKNQFGDQWDTKVLAVGDKLSQYWKFAQLFRLGYAPRALADDFLGQVARFGGQAMMQRAIDGGKVMAEDYFQKAFKKGDVQLAKVWSGKEAQRIEELTAQQQYLTGHHTRALAKGTSGNRTADDWAQQLKSNQEDLLESRATHADMLRFTAEGQAARGAKIGREIFDPAFGGQQGQLYKDLASGKDNYARLMGDQSDAYLRELRRLDWEYITPKHGEEKHMAAWMRQANDIIGQSSIGRQALMGKSEQEITNWLKHDAAGQAYRQDIGLKHITDFELAQRVKAEVDHVLPPQVQGMDYARQAILQGKLEKEMLEVMPAKARPMVNAEAFHYASGKSGANELIDRGINAFYNAMNTKPAAHLLRNPLFNQMYKAHLADSMQVLKAQGVTHITEKTRATLQEGARQKSLRDVKKFTFTMDHETKMNYSMRHFGAFFGAQQESWNRWARIIAEKPQALAHVAQTYGAPARAGMVVDQDGNPVDGYGQSTNYETGEKQVVPYSDRKILIQVPDYLGGKAMNKALGLDEDASLVIPMSSLELVMNNGDGALPVGAGPIVQIATNQFAKDDPKFADWSQKLGVLPFGPQASWTDFINPNTGKKLSDSTDDFSETKQRTMLYAMQVENYKYMEGLRDTKPTWTELSDRAERWSIFRTAAAFALPFSVNGQDPYQFFRDEFNRMQKLDQKSADEKFYEKYGDSFYSFSQSMSKNNTGLRATAESVQMSKYYKDLIDKVGPEYAGLIVGAEGEGKYSNGAYFYQKTHSSDPASATGDRTNMSARESWEDNQVALGWKIYGNYREGKYAELFSRGLQSFNDPGAEDLKEDMDLLETVLSTKEFDDGTANDMYNSEWTKAFNIIDKGKYNDNASHLQDVVDDPELWAKAKLPDGTVGVRSDIYTLRTYLAYRKNFQETLAYRSSQGGSDDPNAQSNADLKDSWDRTVVSLIEADTKFSAIHTRFFAADMGFSQRTQEAENDLNVNTGASLTGQRPPSMMDVLDEGAMNG